MIASIRSPSLSPRLRPADDSGAQVLVVGAGMGGLAAALRLSTLGFSVTVLEKAPTPGGKIRQQPTPLGPIDLGPTVCTMRWVFDELLADCSLSFDELVDAEPLEVIAHHRWPDGSRLNLYADAERSRDAIGRFAGGAELRRHDRFLASAAALYRSLEDHYLRAAEPSLLRLLRRAGLAGMLSLGRAGPFASLWQRLGRSLGDPRLRQLYARYATYCGSSPLDAPATLMLIAHVERQGVWRIRGGMGRLARALADVAQSQGVRFRFGETVETVLAAAGRAAGVRLKTGEELRACAVVVNGDVRDLQAGGLGPDCRHAVRRTQLGCRSLSAVTWAGTARLPDAQLHHHNIFFSDDYPAEFAALFDRRCLPSCPTVYLCAADRPLSAAPAGRPERQFFLINAPPDGDRAGFDAVACAAEGARSAGVTLERCGLAMDLGSADYVATTPEAFHRLFPSTGGALYGPATHGWRAAFRRSGARCPVPGLYLAGGSVHPGAGVPMAALSGLGAAQCVASDLGVRIPPVRRRVYA